MININCDNREMCCGCASCANICPRHCIKMTEDFEGFYYPVVQTENCINCGLCEKKCPILSRSDSCNVPKINTFAGKTNNDEIRNRSSSGGIFFEIAQGILLKGGHVYGVQVTEDCVHFEHTVVDNVKDLYKILGSKYGESTNHCFQDVKNDLNNGILVLYSGTPCQVEALKLYLGIEYDNLLCVDFICHGVPSTKTWKQYIKYFENKIESKVIQVNFRNKKNGWQRYALQLIFDNGKDISHDHADDMYMKLFLNNVSVRPSCYSCKFRKIHRVSDITLGDFWGIKKFYPELDDDNGTSLIVVHSEAGANMLNTIIDKIYLKEVDSKLAFIKNPSVTKQFLKTPFREKYFKRIDTIPIDIASKTYSKTPIWKIIGGKFKTLFSKVKSILLMQRCRKS